MIERDHTPNAGTGLLGANFRLHNRAAPTNDAEGGGRWIAIDESGYNGDQLHGGERYMTLGAVAVDDITAADIVDRLRAEGRIQQSAPEVKFQKMFTGASAAPRRQLLSQLLGPTGPLYGKASVYVIDKYHFVLAKLVDLLIEEQFHSLGLNIVDNGVAPQMALDLATEGPRALGRDNLDRLIATTVGFFAKRNRRGDHVTVDEFYTVIGQCRAYARRRRAPQAKKATQILELLCQTRPEAEAYARERPTQATPTGPYGLLDDSMDPLIPAIPSVILRAAIHHGERVRALADDQRLLTDDKLDVLQRSAAAMGAIEQLIEDDHLGGLLRGRSTDHPSLQLADLVAGAGLTVARRHDGETDSDGDDLYTAVVPLIDRSGLIMGKGPEDFATVDPRRLTRG